jgi:hypothetical protein
MSFNKDNAALYGGMGGKWTKPPGTVRNKKLLVTLTQAEFDAVTAKAKTLKLSKAELVIRAVNAYDKE